MKNPDGRILIDRFYPLGYSRHWYQPMFDGHGIPLLLFIRNCYGYWKVDIPEKSPFEPSISPNGERKRLII